MTNNRAKTCAEMSPLRQARALKMMEVAEASFERAVEGFEEELGRLGAELEPACPSSLAKQTREIEKALIGTMEAFFRVAKLRDGLEEASAGGAIDLEEARDEIARRLDRLAA